MDIRAKITEIISSVKDECPREPFASDLDKETGQYKAEEIESVVDGELVELSEVEDKDLPIYLYSAIAKLESECKVDCAARYALDESGNSEDRARLNGKIIAKSLIKNGLTVMTSEIAREEMQKRESKKKD
jgi:hypothetical protein